MSLSLTILSGCSGGGKSTLLAEMHKRGYSIVPEAGRRVVAQALSEKTDTLPWKDPLSFVRACAALHLNDLAQLDVRSGPVFLDRSLIDVISFLELKGLPVPGDLNGLMHQRRYADKVFIVPPWPEIFETDAERKASFADAVEEYGHLCRTYRKLGFSLSELPKRSVEARADHLEAHLLRSDLNTISLGTD